MSKVTIRDLISLGEELVELSHLYKIRNKGELFFDAIMHALLTSRRRGRIERQFKLPLRPGQRRRQRLDFRIGGTAPVVIELACRRHPGQLSPSQNRSELNKLTRFRQATTRFLLLVDASAYTPANSDSMIKRYRSWNSGAGRFNRLPVRLVYARPGYSFHFLWRNRDV